MSHTHSPLSHSPRVISSVLRQLWSSDVNADAVDLLDPQPGHHVLDLGSGFGSATALLAKRVSPAGSVTAVEPSCAMRMIGRVRALRHPRLGIAVRAGRAERLDLPDSSINAVLSLNAMHHYGDLALAARELHRVLKPGGHHPVDR